MKKNLPKNSFSSVISRVPPPLSSKPIRFLIVGTTTVALDLFAYYLLIKSQFFNVEISKAISFIIGSIYSYQLNRAWTFAAGKGNLFQAIRFFLVYASSLFLNVSTNSLFLSRITFNNTPHVILSFLLATVTSATFNYILLKNLVFKRKSHS